MHRVHGASAKGVKTRGAFPVPRSFSRSPAAAAHTLEGSDMDREGMLVRSIYYGRIGSDATERLLERFGHDGSFLLRDSETVEGAYCLCVRWAPL